MSHPDMSSSPERLTPPRSLDSDSSSASSSPLPPLPKLVAAPFVLERPSPHSKVETGSAVVGGKRQNGLAPLALGALELRSPPEGLEEEAASPLARLWQQKVREDDQDFTVHIILAMGGRENGGEGNTAFDLQSLRDMMEEHVLVLPRFSSLLVKTKSQWGSGEDYTWVPVAADVVNHVRAIDITKDPRFSTSESNSGGEVMRDSMMLYAESQSAIPLRRDIPLWEVQVVTHPPITAMTSTSSTPVVYTQSLLWRIHHSVADGIALASLLLKVTKTINGEPPSGWTTIPEKYTRKRSFIQKLMWNASYVSNSLWSLIKLLLVLIMPSDTKGGIKASTTDIRHVPRELARICIPLESAKSIAKSCNGTLNDLMLCLISTAAQWDRLGFPFSLNSKSDDSSDASSASGRGSSSASAPLARSLFMANIRMPTDLKKKGGLSEGEKALTKLVPLGTRIGFFTAELPPAGVPPALLQRALELRQQAQGVRAHGLSPNAVPEKEEGVNGQSPAETSTPPARASTVKGTGEASGKAPLTLLQVLDKVRQRTESIKHSFEAWAVYQILVLVYYIAGPMGMWQLIRHVLGRVTTALSNVPGPPETLLLAGSPILSVDQFLAGGPLGATVHAVSYAGTLYITVTANPETVKAKQFGRLLLLAWEQLQLEHKQSKLPQN